MGTIAPPQTDRTRRAPADAGLLPRALLLFGLLLLPPAGPAKCEEPPPADASIEALWSRGEAAFNAGDLDEAQRLFDVALSSDERRARSWNYVGGVHFAQGDLSRALTEFRTALELDPLDVRVHNNLGTVLERLGDYAGAEAAYALAAQIDPAYPVTQRNLGILYSRRLNDPEAARRAWARYLELAPDGPYANEVRRELAALPAPAEPPAAQPAR
jgi:tetratricopeptide (TPR) repeat protein